ncbi:hypothetical protein Ga0466249_002226 [Sporomusaceae bacterium BoRhaA]|uniref:hypothetical protein n=1 Tax=Pelorhabdus rhamnosifermentans TaxID=2772457 RepID=UPI001C0606C4|nr:hypothetical protein [Pelorhabdus rhamnosifermentans]MBU2701115.1 hypothetical protein [Pelorhabdus rhamnosifermentans]
MKIDYEKLLVDLKKAKVAAIEAAGLGDDGGTANLDSLVLRLPGAREKKVLEVIRTAGLYCREKGEWLGPCYFISHGCGGQGNRNTRAVEAMDKSLEAAGWHTGIYYRMD